MLRKFMLVIATLTALTGLTACGIQHGDDDDKANIADLEARGFTDPVLVNEGAELAAYSASVGKCRLTIEQSGHIWVVTRINDKDVKALRDVDVAMLEAKAKELDLEYCFDS